ncbi:MAG: ATP-binding protein [bacterium]
MNVAIKYHGKIGNRLVITFVLFVTIFIGTTGWFLYRTAKNSLDDELGGKLIAVAQAVTTQIDARFLMQLQPGDETTLTYANILNKLNRVKEATKVKRLYVFDRHSKSLVDTEADIKIGTEYIRLRFDKSELESLWNGNAVHTVLFKGDNNVFYKSGYAPIKINDEVVAAVGVDTSATFMKAIKTFRQSVILFVVVSILITIVIGFIFAQTITRPVNELVKYAEEIGKGNFSKEISIKSNDELGYLGNAMETMRKSIIERDNGLRMMLANVAHEIRNPLGGIEIFAGLLAEELQGTPKEHTEKIIKEVKNLNDIVTQFLEFARPAEPIKEITLVDELIDDVIFLLSPEFDKKEINLRKELNHYENNIYVDPNQIKRVFMNILKNGIQVMENGGEFIIKSKRDEEFINIMISNNGPNIPKEDLEKIFDPFFTTKEKGAGLGLSIVKKLVDDNDGYITVRSEPGDLTTFSIYLPIAKR